MNNKEKSLFGNIAVIATGENLFSQQLKQRGIRYTLCDMKNIDLIKGKPSLVLVINLGLKTAEMVKSGFPQAQVITCQGGKKAFASFLTVVHGKGEDNHDYYYYHSWDQFIDLIRYQLIMQKKLFLSIPDHPDGEDYFQFAGEKEDFKDETRLARQEEFELMMRMSVDYLKWYLDWLRQVENTEFNCSFDYPLKVKKRKKVRKLSVPYDVEFHTLQGKEIFSVDDEITFFDNEVGVFPAIVVAVNEQEIIFWLKESITRRQTNDLIGFTKETYVTIPSTQLELSKRALDNKKVEKSSLPFRTLAGQINNWMSDDILGVSEIYLPKTDKRILRDESQCQAIAPILNLDSHTLITTIIGPPGSGKTFIQALAAKQFWLNNKISKNFLPENFCTSNYKVQSMN